MAGIVQQLEECRNAATLNLFTKKRGREKGFPATNFARGKKLSRSSGVDCSFLRGLSATADSQLKSIDRPHCARRRRSN